MCRLGDEREIQTPTDEIESSATPTTPSTNIGVLQGGRLSAQLVDGSEDRNLKKSFWELRG